MLHFERWKIIAILLTCLTGFLFALPNFVSKETLATWPDFMPKRQMPLGLDLRGGAHLLLAMDQDEIRKDWLQGVQDAARASLRDAKIGFSGIGVDAGAVKVTLVKPEDAARAETELKKLVSPIGNALLGTAGTDLVVAKIADNQFTITPTPQGFDQRLSNAATASIETINRRVNALGTAESTVVRQGKDRILVQYPGLSDTSQLKKLIGQTAKLSFHTVHATVSPDEARATRVPLGYKIYQGTDRAAAGGQEEYVLQETAIVPGDDLEDAQPGFDQRTTEPIISFRFNTAGARKFGKYTQDNVGRPFAIVLDDKVISAPVIREPILGGTGQISGNFTVESANNLAIQLRSGALPAKLTVVEERTVGPSLGADSIEAGMKAGLVGLTATAIMTILAYGTFGVYAVIGLIVHGILILALMSAIGTTLTLPGIAGFVLTIAMAVDANVLIYERIREEVRAGKTAIAAIDGGFQRAIVTILDSQLTTLAAALIMFWLGSGPIRGFAVTLSLGIITSVFAAVTITRLLVAMWLKNAKTAKGRALQIPI
jgi:preprotein translocase subunit SecD